jgi:hypothetical protein
VIHTVDDLAGRLELRIAVGRNKLSQLPAGEPAMLHSSRGDPVSDLRIKRFFGISDQIHNQQSADSLVIGSASDLYVSAATEQKAVAWLRIPQHSTDGRARVVFVKVGALSKLRNGSEVMSRFPHKRGQAIRELAQVLPIVRIVFGPGQDEVQTIDLCLNKRPEILAKVGEERLAFESHIASDEGLTDHTGIPGSLSFGWLSNV